MDQEKWRDTEEEYDFIYIADNIFAPIYDVIAQDVLEDTGIKEGVLLDIGCGGGHLGRAILQHTEQKGLFLDINAKAIQYAKERAESDGLMSRCTFYCADVEHMPIPDGSVNLVVSRGSMQFWNDREAAFLEIYRVMAPGAKTYIGGGCGNAELYASISEKMDELGMLWGGNNPAWKDHYPDEQLYEMFERLGFSYQVRNAEGKGRWITIQK